MNRTVGMPSAETYRNTRLEKYPRTTRLDNERWQQIKHFGEDEERVGKAPVFNLDSTVPFKPTLLALYKDLILTLKRHYPENPKLKR